VGADGELRGQKRGMLWSLCCVQLVNPCLPVVGDAFHPDQYASGLMRQQSGDGQVLLLR